MPDQKISQLSADNVVDPHLLPIVDTTGAITNNVTALALAQYAQSALNLLSQQDLANLVSLPEDQAGLRSLDEIVTFFRDQGFIGSGGASGAFAGLTDVFSPNAEQRGDGYFKDGAGHMVSIPFNVWSSASAMAAWIAGTGGTAPLLITTSGLPPGTVGALYTSSSAVLTAQGGSTPYAWSSTALPAGLSLNATTGAITGTPTAAGTTAVTFTVTGSAGGTNSVTLSIVVAATTGALAFPMPALPNAQVGTNYNYPLAPYANGGNPPYVWQFPSLPNHGVHGDTDGSATGTAGTLYGTPNASGPITVSVTIFDTPTSTVAISSCSESGTTATFNTSTAHGLTTNDWFVVAGVTPAGYNGHWQVVTHPTTTQITAVLATGSLGVGTAFGTLGKVARVTASQALTINPAPTPATLADAFHAAAATSYGREPLTPLATNDSTYTAYYTAAVAAGHIYYVNPATGSDAAAGSIGAPFKTVAHALGVAGVLTVVLRNGVCREAFPISATATIMSYPGEYGWISGMDIVTGWVRTYIGYAVTYDMTKLNRLHTLGQSTTASAGITLDQTPRTLNVASTAAAGAWPAFPTSASHVGVVNGGNVVGYFSYTGKTGNSFLGVTADGGGSFAVTNGDAIGGGNAVPYAFYDNFILASSPMAGYPDQVLFDGRPLKMVSALGSVTPGTFTFWTDVTQPTTSVLVISEDPTGHTVEVTTRPTMITGTSGGGPASTANGTKFYGVGMYGFGTTFNPSNQQAVIMAVGGTLSNLEMRYCVFAYNANMAWSFNTGSGHIVDNCVHIYQGCLSAHGNNADTVTIENSRFQYSNDRNFDTAASSFASIATIKVSNGTGWTIIRNLFLDNNCNGPWQDVSQQDTLFACNRVQRNKGWGVVHEVSPLVVYFNNIVTDNAYSGIKCADTSKAGSNNGALIWNNTTVNNGNGPTGIRSELFLYDDPRTTWTMDKTEVYNNVMVAANASSSSILYTNDGSSGNTNSAAKMLGSGTTGGGIDRNFYVRLAAYSGRKLAQVAILGGTSTSPTTIAALRTALTGAVGAEANGALYDAATNALTEIFNGPASGDFSLTGTVLSSAPTPATLSATLVTRLNAHMGSAITTFVPATVGASDATGVSAGIGTIPQLQ